jgi:hypothetical protein
VWHTARQWGTVLLTFSYPIAWQIDFETITGDSVENISNDERTMEFEQAIRKRSMIREVAANQEYVEETPL